jgi:hypothetical protein
VTSIEYLNIFLKKTMDKTIAMEIKEEGKKKGGQVIEKNNKSRDRNILCSPKLLKHNMLQLGL